MTRVPFFTQVLHDRHAELLVATITMYNVMVGLEEPSLTAKLEGHGTLK
jgi:hypothetical protein